VSIYPYAPVRIDTFLRDRLFRNHPPDIVVLAVAERFIGGLRPPKDSFSRSWVSEKRTAERSVTAGKGSGKKATSCMRSGSCSIAFTNRICSDMFAPVFGDPFWGKKPGKSLSSKHGPIFFLQGKTYRAKDSRDQVTRAANVVRGYDQLFKNNGIRFIFLPIPEKESIYYGQLGITKPLFLDRLTAELQAQGIETVELQRAFEHAFQRG